MVESVGADTEVGQLRFDDGTLLRLASQGLLALAHQLCHSASLFPRCGEFLRKLVGGGSRLGSFCLEQLAALLDLAFELGAARLQPADFTPGRNACALRFLQALGKSAVVSLQLGKLSLGGDAGVGLARPSLFAGCELGAP